MAKSSNTSFRDTLAGFAALSESVQRRQFASVYLLMGDEPYFIDVLSERLATTILAPDQRAFNQTMLYGADAQSGAVVNLCRQLPMGGDRQVVIVREAQMMSKIETLALYTAAPAASTILVICYKGSLDKRTSFYKSIVSHGQVFESVHPRYDSEIVPWIESYVRQQGYSIEPKASAMLVEFLGMDLSRIANNLTKLMACVPTGTTAITPDVVERNIGISKEFNNFELTRALSERDMVRAMRICDHFARNPKSNPLVVTLGVLFTHFQRIFILNYQMWLARRKNQPMPQDRELMQMMKLSSPFFLKEYRQAASLYSNQKVFAILGLLRDYDLKSKGLNAGQNVSDGDLLKELLLKILMI